MGDAENSVIKTAYEEEIKNMSHLIDVDWGKFNPQDFKLRSRRILWWKAPKELVYNPVNMFLGIRCSGYKSRSEFPLNNRSLVKQFFFNVDQYNYNGVLFLWTKTKII